MQEMCEMVMSRNVVTCFAEDSVTRAARLMRDNQVGMLPVVDLKGRVRGVVTDRDLAVRVLASGHDGRKSVQDAMTTEHLVTVKPTDKLSDAEEKMMLSGSGHVLVLDEQRRVVGVISRSEVVTHEDLNRIGKVLGALSRHARRKLEVGP